VNSSRTASSNARNPFTRTGPGQPLLTIKVSVLLAAQILRTLDTMLR
jgi:hypothetical protein